MAKQLRSGTINGCLNGGVVELYLLEQVLLWIGSVSCFIQILESRIWVSWLLVFYLGRLRRLRSEERRVGKECW